MKTKEEPGIKSILFRAIFLLLVTTNVMAQHSAIVDQGAAVSMTAKVVSINQKSRKVKLKTGEGQWQIFTAGKSVTNLDQVKKGDTVTVIYTEAVAYQLRKHDSQSGVADSNSVVSAKPDSNAEGAVQKQTTITATIIAIDPNIPSVTFKGPYKETQTIKVKDPGHLTGVKVGDVVDITYTDAIAIKVNKLAKK